MSLAVTNADGEVRAAGGVVCRKGNDGGLEVLLVHRPKYGDWTLPKGKAEAGETDEECAVREVLEETGVHCRTGEELAVIRYRDRFDRPKIVRYWEMTISSEGHGDDRGGEFEPNDEVDELAWLALADAIGRLTYPRDGEVLRNLGSRGQTAD